MIGNSITNIFHNDFLVLSSPVTCDVRDSGSKRLNWCQTLMNVNEVFFVFALTIFWPFFFKAQLPLIVGNSNFFLDFPGLSHVFVTFSGTSRVPGSQSWHPEGWLHWLLGTNPPEWQVHLVIKGVRHFVIYYLEIWFSDNLIIMI